MKTKHFFLTLLLGLFCLSFTNAPKSSEITFLTKMGCGGCVNYVTAQLTGAPGVLDFKVDLPSKEVWVSYDADATDIPTLIKTIGKSAEVKAPLATVTFNTKMGCGGCQKKIETNLASAKGVTEFKADLPTKEVWVCYDSKVTNVAALIEVIGYSATEK